MRLGGGGSLILFRLVLLFCRRFSFGCDSGVGFGVVGGGLVEQGYASLMTGCGACSADCWMSRLVVVGSPWRVSLRQSQLSDVLQRTRVQWELFDYSNRLRIVSNANRTYVTAMFHSLRFWNKSSPGILPAVPRRSGPGSKLAFSQSESINASQLYC